MLPTRKEREQSVVQNQLPKPPSNGPCSGVHLQIRAHTGQRLWAFLPTPTRLSDCINHLKDVISMKIIQVHISALRSLIFLANALNPMELTGLTYLWMEATVIGLCPPSSLDINDRPK